jgi:hypothetical protein
VLPVLRLAVCIGGVYWCVGRSPTTLLNLVQIAALALLPALFLHPLIFPDRPTPRGTRLARAAAI